MLSEIIDHRVLSDAIPQSQGTYENAYGVKRKKATTRGWQVLVEWRDGSTDWIELKDLKESYPVELAMYAVDHKIADEHAFAWWLGSVRTEEAQTDPSEGEDKVLVPNAQVWHSNTEKNQRSNRD